MRVRELHPEVPPGEEARDTLADLGVTALILGIAALPIVCDLLGLGRWSAASLGLGTVGVLWAGREVWSSIAASLRARRRERSRVTSSSCTVQGVVRPPG